MSDQQKLSEHLKKWSEQKGPVYFARDQAAMWKMQAEALETQLAEAIRERDEARQAAKGVGHDWLELMEERDGYKAQRDALAKALQNVAEAISSAASTYARLPQDLSIDRREAWVYGILLGWGAVLSDVAVRHGWTEQEVIRLKRYREALAALERPAPADGGKA